jgi:hypothetical protein
MVFIPKIKKKATRKRFYLSFPLKNNNFSKILELNLLQGVNDTPSTPLSHSIFQAIKTKPATVITEARCQFDFSFGFTGNDSIFLLSNRTL